MAKTIDGLDKRLKKLEAISMHESRSQIPLEDLMYIIYETDEKMQEQKIAERQAYLEEKYGPREKTDPPVVYVCFTEPKPLPVETG